MSGPSPRLSECDGRRSISGRSGLDDGVVFQRPSSPASLCDLGNADGVHVRHIPHPETADLCVYIPRRQGSTRGCHVSSVVQHGVTLHVFPMRTNSTGIGPVPAVFQLVSDPDSSLPDRSIVVSRAMESQTVSTDTVVASGSQHLVTRRHSTRRVRSGSALPTLGPTRVASLIRLFVKKGHSARVASFMVKNLLIHWHRGEEWCNKYTTRILTKWERVTQL